MKSELSNLVNGSRVCIFGTGEIAFAIKEKLEEERPDIKFVFFANSFENGEIDGYEIVKLDELQKRINQFDYVIIGSVSNSQQIVKVLRDICIKKCVLAEEVLNSKVIDDILNPKPNYEYFYKLLLNTPLYRRYCNNLENKKIILICNLMDLANVNAFLGNFTDVLVDKIYLACAPQNYPKEIEVSCKNFKKIVEAYPLETIDYSMQNNIFVFFNDKLPDAIAIIKELKQHGIHMFDYYCMKPNRDLQVAEFPEYLEKFNSIAEAYNLINESFSKELFISRLKTIITGDSGYLKASFNDEYYCPFVKPEKNDVVMDIGVSGCISITEHFAKSVGNGGKIYSFEPEPTCFKEAEEKILNNPRCRNVEIFQYGMWDKNEKQYISESGSGSSIYAQGEVQKNICELITMDSFVQDNDIKKVDFIKMDIEGAELNALVGAVETIKMFKPKLAISVYHSPFHLFEIILFINSLNLGYEFFLDHHTVCFYDTVLYAKIK